MPPRNLSIWNLCIRNLCLKNSWLRNICLSHLCVIVALLVANVPAHADVPDYRITDAFDVTTQKVSLTLDPARDNYTGSTQIQLTVSEATESLSLHWLGLTVTDITLAQDESARPLAAQAGDWDMHHLSDGQAIEPGDYTLSMRFSGDYSTDALGLYKVSQGEVNYLFTQFESMYGRRAWPMVDEPDSKIPWDLTITAPADQMVAVNTPLKSQTEADGWITHEFMTSKPMPSYLVALTVGEFDITPIPGMRMAANIYSPKGTGHLTGYSRDITPGILEALEAYFGSEYPYRKLDFVAAPDFAFGAMEHPGLITFRVEALLNGDTPPPSIATWSTKTIVHELAHQWYGNLVTMAWWDDLWLNEAFANWMDVKISRSLFPELRQDLEMSQYTAFGSDASATSKAIRREVKTEEDALIGMGLNYTKGGALLDWIEQAMGEEAFRAGIRRYMKENAWGNATADVLWRTLESGTDFAVADFANDFLNQPGFPLVTVARDGTISQARYAMLDVDVPPLQWTVPLTMKVSKDGEISTITHTLKSGDAPVALEALKGTDWVLPTAGGIGYFIWAIDESQYEALIADLSKLTARERLAVRSNAWRLLGADALGMNTFLQLIEVLLQDPEDKLVDSGLRGMTNVVGQYQNTPLEPQMAQWVAQTLAPLLDEIGVMPKASDSLSRRLLRRRAVSLQAVYGEDKALREELAAVADQWLEDPSSVDSDIAALGLRVKASYFGDKALVDRYIATYQNTEDATVKRNLRSAFGFRDPEAVTHTLERLVEGPIVSGDYTYALYSLFSASRDKPFIYRELGKQWEDLVDRVPENSQLDIPTWTNASACDATDLEVTQAFYKERDPRFKANLDKAIETSRTCIKLKQRSYDAVEAYLLENT